MTRALKYWGVKNHGPEVLDARRQLPSTGGSLACCAENSLPIAQGRINYEAIPGFVPVAYTHHPHWVSGSGTQTEITCGPASEAPQGVNNLGHIQVRVPLLRTRLNNGLSENPACRVFPQKRNTA